MFDIRDYLDQFSVIKTTRTNIICKCPVCLDDNLKINKNNGAYKCWSQYCDPKDIRAKLNLSSVFGRKHKVISPFARVKHLKALEVELPPEIKIQRAEKLSVAKATAYNYMGYPALLTVYKYSPNQEVMRIEYKEAEKRVKKFFFKIVKPDGTEEFIKGSEPWQWYGEQDLVPDSGNTVIVVEGEKCADYLRSRNFVALSPAGHGWSETDLRNAARRLKAKGVECVVYFADNDTPGQHKTELIKESLWAEQIACKVIEPATYWSSAPEGADVADYLETHPDINLETIML